MLFIATATNSLLGLIGDIFNCAGGILLAWDAIHRERDFARIKSIAGTLQGKQFAKLRVVMEGIQIVDEADVECAFIRRSARKAVAGCILLVVGFSLQTAARIRETFNPPATEATSASAACSEPIDRRLDSSYNRKVGRNEMTTKTKERTTLGVKSQTVVPRHIREHMGIGQGDQIDWAPGPNRTAILYGRLSVPTDILTPELMAKLDARELAMESGGGIHVTSLQELAKKRPRRS